ncbi:UPF0172-domain-containing protein [Lichtheimia hyalospora FSU 10163]|nr:UPF0172-domain-containing protein [Lichtheimia hyalospora FSU 10163]
MTIQVGPRAFALPLLHAAKHPEALVCGVLLGELNADGSVNVKTGLPFFHHWTSMSPMLEIALQQAELAAKQLDLKVIGWYQANPRSKDNALHENAVRVANVIKKNSGDAIVFMVNNDKMGQLHDIKDGSVISPYIFRENQWRGVKQAFSKDSEVLLSYEETYPKVRGMFSSGSYNRLVDFDEHLEDVSLPWLDYCQSS